MQDSKHIQSSTVNIENKEEVHSKEAFSIAMNYDKLATASQPEILPPTTVYGVTADQTFITQSGIIAEDVGTGTLVIYAQEGDQTTPSSNVIFQSQGEFLLQTATNPSDCKS